MAPPRPATSRGALGARGHLAALGVLLGALGVMVVALPPRFRLPMLDDWSFLLVTLRLARTGVLRYVQCNDPCLLSHVLLGAGWLRLLGPSVVHLRILTLLLSLLAAYAVFGILAELGLDWGRCLLGALVFQLNPLNVFCSYSWLTDTPWLAFTLLATWAALVGVRGRPLLLWAAAGLSFVAILNRQTAMAVPLGLLAYLAWRRWRGERLPLSFWLAALAPILLGFVGLKLAEQIPDFQKHGFPIPSLRKQYGAIPFVCNLGIGFLALSLLPFAAAYAGPLVRAVRRDPTRWSILGLCGLLAIVGMAAPPPALGQSALARYGAEALLLPVRLPFGTGTSYFLYGYGPPLFPRWLLHGLGVATLGWIAVLVAFVLDRALARAWPVRLRPVPRGARFGWVVGIGAGVLLVVALAGIPVWATLARRLVAAAHQRGYGQGRGLEHWLAMARPLTVQAATAAAACLAVVLIELLWQRAMRRAAQPDAARARAFLLWTFVEFAAVALAIGPLGALLVVLLAKLLWRWRAERPAQEGSAWDSREIMIHVAAGVLFVFLVAVLSRWEVYKRHFLPCLFPAILLVLRGAGPRRPALAPALLVGVAFLAYALVQTDVYVAQMQATEDARRQLIAGGVDAKQVRTGLELDGLHWRRYCLDHPDERGQSAEDSYVKLVPVLSDAYLITGGLHPQQRDVDGYAIHARTTFRPRLWPGERPLYVLRRTRPAAPPVPQPGEGE